MADARFDGYPNDARFPSPGVDAIHGTYPVDGRFPSPGQDTRFGPGGYGSLVSNGDFSQIGPELVVNGTFDAGPDVTSNGDFTELGPELAPALIDWGRNSQVASVDDLGNNAVRVTGLQTGSCRLTNGISLPEGAQLQGSMELLGRDGTNSINWYLNDSQSSVNSQVISTWLQGETGRKTGVVPIRAGDDVVTINMAAALASADFARASLRQVGQDWTWGDGWSPDQAAGVARCDGSQGGPTDLLQVIAHQSGASYLVTFEVTERTAGAGDLFFGGQLVAGGWNAPGTYSGVVAPANGNLVIRGNGDFTGAVTNIVVREIPNWTFGDGWGWEPSQAICDGSQAANTELRQVRNGPTTGFFVVKFDAVEINAGQVLVRLGGTVPPWVTTPGPSETIQESTTADVICLGDVNFVGAIDNVSVKEGGIGWIFGDGWAWRPNEAYCDGTQAAATQLVQPSTAEEGKDYLVEYEITEASAGTLVAILNGTVGAFNSAPGVYSEVLTAGTGGNFVLQGSPDFVGAVDNVRVSEYVAPPAPPQEFEASGVMTVGTSGGSQAGYLSSGMGDLDPRPFPWPEMGITDLTQLYCTGSTFYFNTSGPMSPRYTSIRVTFPDLGISLVLPARNTVSYRLNDGTQVGPLKAALDAIDGQDTPFGLDPEDATPLAIQGPFANPEGDPKQYWIRLNDWHAGFLEDTETEPTLWIPIKDLNDPVITAKAVELGYDA